MLAARIRNVELPKRGTDRSAGLDFFVPLFKDDKEFLNQLIKRNPDYDKNQLTDFVKAGVIEVKPHQHIIIPSGVVINLETVAGFDYTKHDSIAFIAFNKSSIAMRQLDVNAAVGDEDYQDELHLSVTNTSDKTRYIIVGEKLVQFLLVPVKLDEPEEVSIDELFRLETIRGKGCFGSTNKKNNIKLAT